MIEVFLNEDKIRVKELYDKETYQFPIIYSVIDGIQSGKIFVDNIDKPETAFVLHTFGWSQIFGARNTDFLKILNNFLFVEEKFQSIKIRNYSPHHENFFKNTSSEPSERCKFRIKEIKKKKIDLKYHI